MSLLGSVILALSLPTVSKAQIDMDVPRRAQPGGVAMSIIEGLPTQTRYELFTLYQAYIDTVNKRKDQHWHTGLLTGEIIDHPEEALLPARQIEDAIAKREKEIAALEAQLKSEQAEAPPPAPAPKPEKNDQGDGNPPSPPPRPKKSPTAVALKAKRKELKSFKRQLSRSKGISIDWSDDVWASLQKVDVEHWSVTDRTRTAEPRHTGAVVCTPADEPRVCLVFDPWKTGEPDAYEYNSWDQGSFAGIVPHDYLLHGLPDRQ